MGFHSEVPLVSFTGLTHLGITLAFTILRRAGCTDDGGIYNRAAMNLDAVFAQVLLDQFEQLLTQIVGFNKIPELADYGLIRNSFMAQINAHKPAHGARVIQDRKSTRLNSNHV